MKKTRVTEVLNRLQGAARDDRLRLLDLHFARWMNELSGSDEPLLLLAAALASSRVGAGDVCVDLAAYAGRPLFALEQDGDAPLIAPGVEEWRGSLRRSDVVGAPGDDTPLILDARDRLYLGRYWRFERDLADALRARSGVWAPDVDRAVLRAGLDRLFPLREDTDWQRIAAAMAVLLPFCVISGGPGTGKTRTVTAILALLLEQAGRPLRIGMAAPTGKAATRLVASSAAARQQLSLSDDIAQGLPTEAATLHRLLGFRPGRSRPRHGRDNPLHLDVLVVDEASMVDLPLMSRLLSALRPETRLILLGDKDQLASVEPGMVLGDICGRGRVGAYSEPLCQALAELAGARLQPVLAPPIADHVAVLRESYRFAGHPGIAAAATSVNLGQGDAAVAVLTDPGYPDAQLDTVPAEGLRDYLRRWLVPRMRTCLAATEPAQVLEGFNRWRVLCAVREGPFGVHTLNRLCESVLLEEGVIARIGHEAYAGHPLLVTSNDYRLGLYNGDVGMALADGSASRQVGVWFDTGEGPRRVAWPRIPSHETAFAMTVHKSQGSEFEEVILILPHHHSRAMTRELLYTGITRARDRVVVIGSPESVVTAASSRVDRVSGLYEALWL